MLYRRRHTSAVTAAFVAAAVTAIAVASLSAPAHAGPAYKCVPRNLRFSPPPRTQPFAVSIRLAEAAYRLPATAGGKAARATPPMLKPVCPGGQVPVSTIQMTMAASLKSGVAKGNPLIGPSVEVPLSVQGAGAYIRTHLRPFNQVYWKGHADEEKDYRLIDPPGCFGVLRGPDCYYYANAAQRRDADGGGMTMQVERPAYVDTGGPGHTLDEIAVQGGPRDGNIVELGWNVSTDQYGDTDPHLFVFHWMNWSPTCYDDCNWQQWSATYFPHQNLGAIAGRSVYIGYVFYHGNWWAWFDNQWLGYFPGSEWAGTYTRSALIQWFGEVSTRNGIPPMTQMGDGVVPPAAGAAAMITLCDVDAAQWVCWYRDQQVLGATLPAWYDIRRIGFGATAYGGPGR